jgi:lipooligosaccharide transport system permease protein
MDKASRAAPRKHGVGGSSTAPSGALVVCEHLVLVWRRFLVTTVATAILNPLLYLTALGLGLGSLVNKGADSAALGGVSYVQFLAPALLCAAAVQTGVSEGAYPVLSGFIWSKIFWGMTATPLTPRQVADGEMAFVALRVVLGSALYYLVVLAFGAAGGPAGVLAVPIATLTGLSCAVWVTALAAVMRSEGNGFNLVFRLIVMPMTLFSGTFFPIGRLPLPVRALAWISPLWHGNELSRSAALGGGEWGVDLCHLGYLLALGAAGMLAVRRKFAERLIV